jgi:hypothetical protein
MNLTPTTLKQLLLRPALLYKEGIGAITSQHLDPLTIRTRFNLFKRIGRYKVEMTPTEAALDTRPARRRSYYAVLWSGRYNALKLAGARPISGVICSDPLLIATFPS